MDVLQRLGGRVPVIGMVHLPALPGAPDFEDRESIRERAVADAEALATGGVDAVLVENFGDVPFHPEDVPVHVATEMTAATRAVRETVECPVGVNVLRNDAEAALAVAAAAGGSFVRVNVHVGARVTDQGTIEGRAHETIRLRDRIDADVAVLADVAVKHSAPLADRPVEAAVADLLERGRADGLVVSGPATGEATDAATVDAVASARDAVDPDAPVLVGSGVTAENASTLLARADGAIVGSSLKPDGDPDNPVDPDRVARLVDAV